MQSLAAFQQPFNSQILNVIRVGRDGPLAAQLLVCPSSLPILRCLLHAKQQYHIGHRMPCSLLNTFFVKRIQQGDCRLI